LLQFFIFLWNIEGIKFQPFINGFYNHPPIQDHA
jgi:hypothetical protein